MILTNKQNEGLIEAIRRYKAHEKVTVISGYAGTGKSTLVKFIIAEIAALGGVDPDHDVCYSCFTGKACQVLQKKGNKNVLTLHKLLYDSRPKLDGGFIRIPRTQIDYKIVIVDEVSMAPKSLIDLLFKHKVHVICLGDPFQLPPVDKDEDNHLLDNPHIFLDEIMRQAAESEIIRLSMKIRHYEAFESEFKQGKEVCIYPLNALSMGMLNWSDQVLVGTNATRISINNQMRQFLGRGDKPEDGDKLICLRNYWDDFSDDGAALVNGTIGYLEDSFESFHCIPRWVGANIDTFDVVVGNFISDSGERYPNLTMDKKLILTGEKSLDWRTSYKMSKSTKLAGLVPKEFAYGYAITGHKSQGSEWDKVLVIEENFPYNKEEHARWLYTTVTRSAKKLVLIR